MTSGFAASEYTRPVSRLYAVFDIKHDEWRPLSRLVDQRQQSHENSHISKIE